MEEEKYEDLVEAIATIILNADLAVEEKMKTLSDDELKYVITHIETKFAGMPPNQIKGPSEEEMLRKAKWELRMRYFSTRMDELKCGNYCCHHDCASTDCPQDSHEN